MTPITLVLELDAARDLLAAAQAGTTHAYVDRQRLALVLHNLGKRIDEQAADEESPDTKEI